MVESPNEPFVDADGAQDIAADELDLLCPVPADGSQMNAIAWALAGRSFVLEGPPGTGKSQTITNLIANLLIRGRNVLFVAEKSAALDVVQRRLDAVGLSTACLNLHGKDQAPAGVRVQIKAALDLQVESNDQLWQVSNTRMAAAVRQLAGYPPGIHSPNVAGLTAWTAHQATLALGDGPVAQIPESFIATHGGRTGEIRDNLAELPSVVNAAGDVAHHPWRIARAGADDLPEGAILVDALMAVRASLVRLRGDAVALEPLWSTAPDLAVLSAIERAAGPLAAGGIPRLEVLQAASQPGWEASVLQVEGLLAGYRSEPTPTHTTFATSIFDVDLERFLAEAREAASKMLGRKRRLGVIVSELQPHVRAQRSLDDADLVALLSATRAERNWTRALDAQAHALPSIALPDGWSCTHSDADRTLRGAFEATWAAEALMHQHPAGRSVIEEAAAGGRRVSAAAGEALSELRLAWTQFISHLGADDDSVRFWREDRALLRAISEELDTWISDGRDSGFLSLRRWATLNETVRPLRESGLDLFEASLLDRTIDPYDAVAAFDRGVAAASLRERFATAGLDRFDASQHQRATDRYIEESGSLREQMRSHLPARLAERRDPAGHVGALSREVGKARSRLPVRGLLDQFGGQIQSLAPCFLMSPDSVARFLTPGRLDFDIVVFDEASQLRVAESVGALGRARAAIIVGDSRQMPPTSIADTAIAEEDEDGPVEGLVVPADEESILSECVAADLPRQWLSWHYRSQDESLIAFSNVHYYDGRLSSFPTPNRADPRRGVHLRRVAGHFERGKERVNRVEAEAVVAEIRRRLRDPDTADQTIGVVTFNTQQRDLIAGMVERLDDSAVAAALELEAADRLFVKNLENVQGDERDVILFSLGFSTDPNTGKLPLNFGPLNRGGGERRLNVAVTRARMLVILFASFSPADIDLAKTRSVGLAHLRTYLEMAEAGSDRVADVLVRPPSGRDLHREDVAAALRARGLRVETQVGLSDFTIDIAVGLPDEHDWRVAVLLDGPGWARRSTVADRDGFPLSFLTTAMRWPDVARVWLPSWLVERDAVLDDLERRVHATKPAVVEMADLAIQEASDAWTGDDAQFAGEGQAADAFDSGQAAEAAVEWDQEFEPLPDETGQPEDELAPVSSNTAEPDIERSVTAENAQGQTASTAPILPAVTASTFVAAPEPLLGDRAVLDDLANRENRARVLDALSAAITAEGPIEVERLVKVVAGQFALNRVRYERISALKRLLPARTLRNEQIGTYAWPPDLDPGSWNAFRRQSSYLERPLDAIAPQEIANAVLWVLERRGGEGDWEAVLREAVEQFGYNRVTAPIRFRMQQVRGWATRRGKLVVDGSHVRRP